MQIFQRLRAIFTVVAKRVLSQPGLILATTLGLIIAIALMMSIPLYADAIYYRIFKETISEQQTVGPANAPSFAYLFRYDGSFHGTADYEELVPVDAYLTETAPQVLGLPHQFTVRYLATDPFGVFGDVESAFETTATPLVWGAFSFISDIQEHITVVEGRFPAPATQGSDSPVEVMIYESLASEAGFQVGETYIAYTKERTEDGFVRDYQIPIRIAGVWRADDPEHPFWFIRPTALAERLIVPEATFTQRVGGEVSGEVYTAAWHIVLSGAEIHHSDAGPLIRRSITVQQKAAGLMPNTKLAKSPTDALVEYRRSANLLTILLYAFSVPILGLLLAFITLTSGLAVERRRNEIAVLRSRGAMGLQMIGIALLESLLLGLIAMAFSAPTGISIAQVIGQARSFLDFGAGLERLRVTLTMPTLRFGFIGVILAVAAQVIPTFGAADHTIVSYKRERARMLRPPWWQRLGLDVILLIPAVYGAYLLRQQGSVVMLQDTFGADPLQNPLLFLVPALGIFALTLLFLRLMPVAMSGVTWLASRTRAVGLLMASRHLARTPGFYTTPLVLLVLTLSLSAFTASLAFTLDQHLHDQHYYRVGADLSFPERGEGQQGGGIESLFGGGETTSSEEDAGPRWLFPPVTDYLNAAGAEGVTRVGRYPAVTRFVGGIQTGVYVGVDRAAFANIAFWRPDFADQSLGGLMNALAVTRNGVLVPEDFLQEHVMLIGDDVRVVVKTYGMNIEMDMKIVGTFELFPTWYPSEGPLFVGNLEYMFEQAGSQLPYEVWMAAAPGADLAYMADEELPHRPNDWDAPSLNISDEQQQPQRQGLFGLLSVGFAAAAVLTVLGFLLYALFSFRRRFIEFGVLRAVGLSARQMTAFLGWELALLILMGGGLGTALGSWVSAFFIPFLQVGVEEVARIPPYVVDIAWSAVFRVYALFGVLFVAALATLVAMLRRMKIFQAIKLGETA
jgi:putative ABC transport system permease protein